MTDIEVIFQQKGEKNISIKINSDKKFSELIDKYYRNKCIRNNDKKIQIFVYEK